MVPVDIADEVLAPVEATSALRFRNATVLRDGRAIVIRADALSASGSASTIIKRFNPGYQQHFLRERAGLHLLSRLPGEGFAPKVLHENEATLALVLEDVQNGVSLERIVKGTNALTARDALIAVAARLGTVHTRARSFGPALRALPPVSGPGAELTGGISNVLRFLELAFGTAAALHARAALLELARQTDSVSHSVTMTLGDLAPSNVLLRDHTPVFLDLEYCGSRHAFYDAVFWRCICPMPEEVVTAMDCAYLQGASGAGVELTERQFGQDMLIFAAHRTFWTLSWNMDAVFAVDRDFVPGVSARAIVRRYLKECLTLAERHGEVGTSWIDLLATLADRLSELWPEADPAFELPCFAGTLSRPVAD